MNSFSLTFLKHYPAWLLFSIMPEKFTTAFAERLNTISALTVIEAKGEERIIPGRVLIAAGGVDRTVSLSDIPNEILELVQKHRFAN